MASGSLRQGTGAQVRRWGRIDPLSVDNGGRLRKGRDEGGLPAGWQIQIGAYTGESEAQSNLQSARSKLGAAWAKAHAFTEKTVKGSVEYIRARFAGFRSEADAKKACEALRKNDFACITVKD